MERLEREGVVVRDTLSFVETRDATELIAVVLRGRLLCRADTLVRVEKRMAVRRGAKNHYEVRTIHYQYHAWVRGRGDRPRRDLVRMDTNPHRPGLHAHLFDANGREVSSPDVSLHDMPTLDAFIRHVAVAIGVGRPEATR
jgi:hypothetical protein